MSPGSLFVRIVLFGLATVLARDALPDDALVIEGVTLIDVLAGRAVPDTTVVVEGDRIAAVLGAGSPILGAPRVVDGRGLFLVPGLFDTHVHYSSGPAQFGPMMLANGVTAARDTGADTNTILAMREALADGTMVGPELFVTGAIVDGDPPIWPFSAACDTPDLAREAVRELAEAGVDQIKVYSRLRRDVWAAAIDESHRQGLKAIGHVPNGESIEDALELGQDGVEHLSGFDVLIGEHAEGVTVPNAGEWSSFGYWRHLAQADPEALRAVYARLAEAEMVMCPTMVVMEGIAQAADESLRDARLAAYVPAPLMAFWTSPRYQGMGKTTGQVVAPMQAIVKELHRAGVPLVIGTDLANPFVHAGFSVHREMELFQDAGVPAADVLRAATIAPARYLGVDDRLGTIATGKTASMVLLRRNPLVDVRNAATIEAVVHRGELFDRAALDGLLATARRVAGGGEAAGSADDSPLAPPGEEIGRGRLAMSFSGFDAGTEEFALTRHDGGYRLQARALMKGGFEKPFFVDMSFDGEGRFREGVYRQLVDRPIVATYTLEDGRLEAVGQQGGSALPESVTEIPEGTVMDAPVLSGAFFSLHLLGLAPGERREVDAVTFGRPTWEPMLSTFVVERLDDADWPGGDGAVKARRYASRYDMPGSSIEVETWTDADGVVLRAVLTMPMGKLVSERVDEEG